MRYTKIFVQTVAVMCIFAFAQHIYAQAEYDLRTLVQENDAAAEEAQVQPRTTNTIQTAPALSSDEDRQRSIFTVMGQRMTSYIQYLRSAINKSESIAEQKKKAMTQELNDNIAKVQQQTLTIANAQNFQDLRARFDEMKNFWNEKNKQFRAFAGTVLSAHIKNLISRLELLDAKIDVLISRLSEAEADVSSIIEHRTKFRASLDKAKAEYQNAIEALDKIEASETTPEAQEFFTTGLAHLRAAHALLQEARAALRNLIQAVRGELPKLPDYASQTSTPIETPSAP